jgi:DNA primase
VSGKSYHRDESVDPRYLQYQLDKAITDKEEEGLSIDSIRVDFESEDIKFLTPLIERGLSKETLEYLEIGYSRVKERIVVPVRDPQYKIVGLIGRAVHEWQEPRYLYNKGFKRADVLFNIQNAKHFDECIVVEGSLDCAKVVQSGYKNCVATLGAKVSDNQSLMLRKYFDKIIIFSDNDEAGRAMSDAIIKSCDGKDTFEMTIPSDVKDPCEMSEEEIKQSYENKNSILGGR